MSRSGIKTGWPVRLSDRGLVVARRTAAAYVAWDRATRRRRFVKHYTDAGAARREFAALRALPPHPCLVRARGFFRRRGSGFIVMDYTPGPSLKELVRTTGPLPIPLAVRIAAQILKGLEAVHRAGYVHGDLHAGNVVVTDPRRGRIKIVDFQHAARKTKAGWAPSPRRIDRPPLRLAPELARGVLDERADVYGAGFLLATMLLGREPRPGEIESFAERAGPGSLWNVIATATRSVSGERWRSARAMLAALRRALVG